MSDSEIPLFLTNPKAEIVYNYLKEHGEQSSQSLVEIFSDIPYTSQRRYLEGLERDGYIKRRRLGRNIFWSIRDAGQYSQHYVPGELKIYWPLADKELTIPELIIDCQDEINQGSNTTKVLYEYIKSMVRLALEYYNGDDSSIHPLAEKCRELEKQLRVLQERLPLLMQMVDSILLQPSFFSATEFSRNLIEENPNFPVDAMKSIVLMSGDYWTVDQINNMTLYKSDWLEALFLYTYNKPLTEDEILLVLPGIANDKAELLETLRTLKHPKWDSKDPDFEMFKRNKERRWVYDEMSPSRIKQVSEIHVIAEQIRSSKIIPNVLGRGIICQEL